MPTPSPPRLGRGLLAETAGVVRLAHLCQDGRRQRPLLLAVLHGAHWSLINEYT